MQKFQISRRQQLCQVSKCPEDLKIDVVFGAETKRKIDELYEDSRKPNNARSKIYLKDIGASEMTEMSVKAGLIHTDARIALIGSKFGTDTFKWDEGVERKQADR